MEKYIKKAKILNNFFGIYGRGNFDLTELEVARIIEFLVTKDNDDHLEVNLTELYDDLSKTRLG